MTQSTVPSTVSQGLRRVKKLKGLLGEAAKRASDGSTWVEGRDPAFTFAEQRKLRAAHQTEIIRIQTAIARANALTTITVEDRVISLAQAIRELEELKTDLSWLGALDLKSGVETSPVDEIDNATGRYVRTQKSITHKAALTEPERAAEVQALRDRFELINDAVETANHKTAIELS